MIFNIKAVEKYMTKPLSLIAMAAFATLAVVVPAYAEPVTLEVVHAWGGHKRFHEPIAEAFMKSHPDIVIKYRASMANYSEGHQTILRQAIADDLPDVWYSPYNALGELVRALNPREQIKDLGPNIAAEGPDWVKANYAPNVLALGQVDGKQWCIPFNASTAITYYNLDLWTKAGGDGEKPPKTWDELIPIAAKISGSGEGADGFAYSVSEWGDDWLWQALVFNYGGTMMDPAKTKVTFGDEAGRKSVDLIARITRETKMPVLNEDQTIEQFAAGKLGAFVGSTAEVRVMGELVGDKFKWKTGGYPLADTAKGGIPTGGNCATILAKDDAKKKAAWEFIKFATGPEGQKIAVLGSGYMPTNLRTTEAQYLGGFYAGNPNWTTSLKQWPIARNWFGYPGDKGSKIWKEQGAILGGIIRGEIDAGAGLDQLVKMTETLLAE